MIILTPKLIVLQTRSPAYDVTDRVLLPEEHGSTSTQDTGDNVTSQPMTAEIFYIPIGPSSPTSTPSAYNVESPVSSGESEDHMTSVLLSLSDGPVSSAEINRVAQRIKEIKRRLHEAADAQTSQAERWSGFYWHRLHLQQRISDRGIFHWDLSLNAEHDANYFTCSDATANVMSTQAVFPKDTRRVSNPWCFSGCSVDAFGAFLNSAKCTRQRPENYIETWKNAGVSYFNADEQCQLVMGPKSYFCRVR
ncbi:hypothetical protein PoB_005304800 [Plakobranchus ocellatus]|uniref:C-type lectin domain-containing protein n=1 Tax=Plakobranchus ocellatus TaxID=259542 RepID=A0AAV4C3R1_9GAST|nr:hypothetical protein PoB_005304800 [Plakobranchus ocellatus]